jgi:hypothetical protein
MSETQWMPRGWVGRADVIIPMKSALDAAALSDVGIVNPPRQASPSIVDAEGDLVGFAIACRPGFLIAAPEGAFEMARPVAEALLSVLVA